MKSFGVTSVLLLTVLLASPSAGEAQVLQPSELCSDHPDDAIATFEDANLEAAIRGALSVGAQDNLTCGLVSRLTDLTARKAGITSLVGIQNLMSLMDLNLGRNPITDISALRGLTSLTSLDLRINSITEISALSGLTSLTDLDLRFNSITDIGALSGLTGLTDLDLRNNPALTDIQPLVDNTGLGVGGTVNLRSTGVRCTDMAALRAALRARGVRVDDVFCWVNPLNEGAHERLSHGTFRSTSMDVEVGYVIYLPPGYDDPANAERRYPVVYHLHGGAQGSERKRANFMTDNYIELIEAGTVPPRIYVLVNGGLYSHYDYGESLGETAFVKELIPHIDGNYRTIATRLGRAIEGFSAGGQGTARIAFEYPELFCSAAAMSGGHQVEKMVSEGRATENVYGIPLPRDYNSWDRASQ